MTLWGRVTVGDVLLLGKWGEGLGGLEDRGDEWGRGEADSGGVGGWGGATAREGGGVPGGKGGVVGGAVTPYTLQCFALCC